MINTNDDVTDAPERNSIVIVREKVTEIEERQNRKDRIEKQNRKSEKK